MSSLINGFILFSLTITFAFLCGVVHYINDYDNGSCEMTYMFEYAQYVRIKQEIDHKYPQYGLYAYSEGRTTSKSRNMDFDGVPVLFIPGNAGSYKQARSLASIALRKWLNSRTLIHFDYFLCDLSKEYSGLNGALLYQQAEYANRSIYTVLNLYKAKKNPPKTVILYAHSVGGIVARHLAQDSDIISILITFATPHLRPIVMLDFYTYNFYKKLSSRQLNTTFVSFSGGYNDILVPAFLTNAPNALNIASTHVPRSWVPTAHVTMVWCKQFLRALNRALFDAVDPKTKQISTDANFRETVFRHHLIQHNGFRTPISLPTLANIRNQGQWVEPMGRQYSVTVPPYASSPSFYMVRLLDQPLQEQLTVVAIELETVEWAFVCGAHIPRDASRVCEEFTHLSHLSELAPSRIGKRRHLTVNLHDLLRSNPTWTHVIVRVLPSDEEVTLHFDVYRVSDRRMTLTLPHILSPKRHIFVAETPERSVRLDLAVPQLTHMLQFYQLFLEPVKCQSESHHATASLIVPWGYKNQHKYFTANDTKPFVLRLLESRPQFSNQSASVQLTLDPSCRYRISVQSSLVGLLSQFARFYSPLLITNVAVVLLMTLHFQLKDIGRNRQCPLFFTAIKSGAKPYYILTSDKLISRFLSLKPFASFVPSPDWLIMSNEGSDFLLLPLVLYLCSVGITWLLGIFLFVSLVLCETTVHKLTLRFLARTVTFNVSWSDYVISGLHKLPCIVAATLVSLTLTTSGSLALCVGCVFYFLRLTQMSQDYIEALVWHYVRKVGQRVRTNSEQINEPIISVKNPMFFHTTIFLLWCLITALNVPSVLTWAHNFSFSSVLKPDPAFLPGLVLSICALPLWQLDWPKIEKKGYNEVSQAVLILAVGSLIYAPVSIFRLNYTLTAAVALVTLHQLVAPSDEVGEERRDEASWYDLIKAKLE